jgi:hypothetical protein
VSIICVRVVERRHVSECSIMTSGLLKLCATTQPSQCDEIVLAAVGKVAVLCMSMSRWGGGHIGEQSDLSFKA